MDNGTKIKNARIKANLTQEQVAASLGVSRQTISNWETEKTYPDIVSVVKMSDLYQVSLDHLLKEETPMSDYLDYLEESTNTVKSKNRIAKLIIILTYLAIWAFSLIVFWCIMGPADALGYGFMFQLFLLPDTALILSLIIGANNYWGKWKWLCVVAFGLMYLLADYASFPLANMIANHRIELYVPENLTIMFAIIAPAMGLGAGVGITRLKALFASKAKKIS